MKLTKQLNKTINEALDMIQLPLEIVADFVAQYGVGDLWAAYANSDRFDQFLEPYNSFRMEFDKFYEENEQLVDEYLLNDYVQEGIDKAKKEGYVFNLFVNAEVFNVLEEKGFIDEEGHIDSDLTPFYVSYNNKRAVTDFRTNQEVEKFETNQEAQEKAIELNKEYCLEQLKG